VASAGPRLLVALKPRPSIDEVLPRSLPDTSWAYAAGDPPSSLASVEAMLIGSVARELGAFRVESVPRLRLVQLVYTGADGFPFERFPEPIQIAANGGAYGPFVAEHAVALALAAARMLLPVQAQMRSHTLRPPPEIRLLYGHTAVILGYGEIGRQISQRVQSFGMRTVAVNRTGTMAPGCSAVYPADRMIEALSEGDVVFDARPLTRATRGTIDARALGAMRPQAIYVNVGRAATADEEAIYRHLVDHPEFRAAFDPWWEEDFAAGTFGARFPLIDLPNFVGTPHSAGFGPATERYALERAATNLARFFRGETPRYLVDRTEYASAAQGT